MIPQQLFVIVQNLKKNLARILNSELCAVLREFSISIFFSLVRLAFLLISSSITMVRTKQSASKSLPQVLKTKERSLDETTSLTLSDDAAMMSLDQTNLSLESSFSEEEEQAKIPAIVIIPPSKEDITSVLEKLDSAKTIDDAEAAIEEIYDLMEKDENNDYSTKSTRQDAAKKFAESNIGVRTIVKAIENWHRSSSTLTQLAIGSLVIITCFASKQRQFVVEISLETVLTAAEKYSNTDDGGITSNAVSLLSNLLATDQAVKRLVTSNERSIDLVLEAMKGWPLNRCIQRHGCSCLNKILKLEDMKTKLQKKKIGALLLTAMDNFRSDEEIFLKAKRVLDVYID